jgi:hypothetical protein
VSDGGRYRKIYTRLWLHSGFVGLNDAEKVVAFYLLTGPQTNRIGLYRLSPATAAEDLETSAEAFRKRLVTVCTSLGWLYDAKARVFYIPSFLKWNPPVNVNVANGITNDLSDLPDCAFIDAFAENLEGIPEAFREAFLKGLRLHMPHGVRNQEQYPDQNQQQEQKHSARRAEALNEKHEKPLAFDNRVQAIARGVLRDSPKQTTEYLVDCVLDECHRSGIACNRLQAITALGTSRVA